MYKRQAYEVAREAHKDQKRKSGEPYIIHPLCVAIILADLEMEDVYKRQSKKNKYAFSKVFDLGEAILITEEEDNR